MTWAKLDDQFFSHPKVIDLSKDAKLVFLAGLTYCAGQLTDGLISPGGLRMIAAQVDAPRSVADELTAAGLWEAVDGGYHVHDYLEYNPTGHEVRAKREARAEAGRIGGVRSGETRAQKAQAKREAIEAKHEANASHSAKQNEANAEAKAKQNRTPYPYPYPYPTTVTDNSKESSNSIIVADADASGDDDSAPHAPEDVIPSAPEPTSDQTAEKPAAPERPEKIAPDAPAMRLAIQLREAVLAHNSTALDARKAMTGQGIQAWARKLEALISDPRRAPPDVEAVIAYAASASFWQPIVINPDKLKKHYDTINGQRLNARNGKNGHSNGGNSNGSMGRAAAAQASRPYHDRSVRSRSGSVQGNAGGWTPERADEFNEQARAIRQQFARSSGGNA